MEFFKNDLKTKLADIEKLKSILSAAWKTFIVPVKTFLQLLRQIVYIREYDNIFPLDSFASLTMEVLSCNLFLSYWNLPEFRIRIKKFVKFTCHDAFILHSKVHCQVLCKLSQLFRSPGKLWIENDVDGVWASAFDIFKLQFTKSVIPETSGECYVVQDSLIVSLFVRYTRFISQYDRRRRIQDILGLPAMIPFRISTDTLNELASLLTDFSSDFSAGDLSVPSLTSCPHKAIWTFGNVLRLLGVTRNTLLLQPGLVKLNEMIQWISPKTFSGNSLLLWESDKTCKAMPLLLEQQLSTFSESSFCRFLCDSCFNISDEHLERDKTKSSSMWADKMKELADHNTTAPSLKSAPSKSLFTKMREAVSNWPRAQKQQPPLLNQSEVSRKLAAVGDRREHRDLANEYSSLLAGFFSKLGSSSGRVSLLLNSVAFSSRTISQRLWLHVIDANPIRKQSFIDDNSPVLLVFCKVLSHLLLISDDEELHETFFPLHIVHLQSAIKILKDKLYCTLVKNETNRLTEAADTLLQTLYERHSRKPLCSSKEWLVSELNVLHGTQGLDPVLRSKLLAHMPYSIPFSERVRIFQQVVAVDRAAHQQPGRTHKFQARRENVFGDGFAALGKSVNLKSRLYVIFVNSQGHQESGIDAGGLFKEFWTTLSGVAFNPEYGLFNSTTDNLLYPNPNSATIHGHEHLELLEFLGCILGKALYEDIVVQPKFAYFFLSKFLARFSMIGDLPSLDSELYKNLMFLKTYEGDVEELCLTFSITENEFGQVHEVELIPEGAETIVNSRNKFKYINLVAHHHLNNKCKIQSLAFLRGFNRLINPQWIQSFTQPELQTLISGQGGGINLNDLKKHSKYVNGFHGLDSTISKFWSVLSEFSDTDKGLLLKFVTSCERPPLLGFSRLVPPFCLHKIPGGEDLLPCASTCFNTLKLPCYSSKRIMKQKLLYAIRSESGFELS